MKRSIIIGAYRKLRAVAIHIVYIDEDESLRIHHFVSDTNLGFEDVAGKYYEAVSKMVAWGKTTIYRRHMLCAFSLSMPKMATIQGFQL